MAETYAQALARIEKKTKALEIKVKNEASLLGTQHERYKADKQSLETCKFILAELRIEFAAKAKPTKVKTPVATASTATSSTRPDFTSLVASAFKTPQGEDHA